MDRETNKKLSQKINREEAIKIFGEEIVNEAEQEQIMKAKEYNQNNQKTLLENEDLIRCNYFTGQAALTDKMSGKTIKISKQEAIKKFGKNAVKEAEKKADANVKVDTSMNEANKKEEEIVNEAEQEQIMKAKEYNQINLEKQQLINEALEAIDNKRITLELKMYEEAKNYEQSYTQGSSDGYAGRAKAKNTPGYNAGYVIGQKLREAENEPDKIIEIKEELFEEDTPRHR